MKRLLLLSLLCLTGVLLFAQADSVGVFVQQNGKYERLKMLHNIGIKANMSGGYAVYPDKTSRNFASKQIKLRVYFGNVPTDMMADYYMFSRSYDITDFVLSEFKVKKDTRLLLSSTYGLF